jgi:uncharacterized protein YcgI (DUF1989 family)
VRVVGGSVSGARRAGGDGTAVESVGAALRRFRLGLACDATGNDLVPTEEHRAGAGRDRPLQPGGRGDGVEGEDLLGIVAVDRPTDLSSTSPAPFADSDHLAAAQDSATEPRPSDLHDRCNQAYLSRRRCAGEPARDDAAARDCRTRLSDADDRPSRKHSVRVSESLTDWDVDEVPPGTGGAWPVPSGGLVRVTDVEGGQSGDVFFVDAVDVTDGLSNGRSFDYNGTVSLTVGATLFSSNSRSLATIVHDDVGRHDFLYAPCSQEMFEIQYAVTAPHPNCYANLTGALAGFGVPAATVTVAFNVFMCTSVAADGRLSISPPRSR